MPTTIRSTRVRAFAALCAFSLLAVACGDDDDTEASTDDTVAEGEPAASGDVEAYCAAAAELDEQDGPPTAEQFENLKELRPEEIGEDVDFVADAFIAADGDMGKAFSDPEVEERLGAVEDWEGENCDSGAEGDFAAAPEHEAYCAATEEMDNQDGPPTEEQLLELKEIRPDAIGEDIDMVADAFIAAEGDVGQVFSDPAIEEAFGRIDAFDAEACGFGDEEDEEEAATEPLEGAEVVDVTAVDFAFEGIPDTVPAGDVSFSFTNEGEAAHEMFMARLGDGVELDDLLAMDEEPSPEQAEEIGAVFGEPGSDTVYLNGEGLEPGTYAVVCFIPGPGGKAHYELGMKQTFTVS